MAIEAREGVILHAYKDSKGLPTIGVGHLIVPDDGFNMKSRITQQQCDDLFAQDIQKYESAVNRCVKVPLTQNQFDACVSFCLNIGTGGFCGSSVVKRINKGDIAGAGQAFMMWKKPPEIIGRRRSEQKQFLTPYPKVSVASPTQPEPGLNSKDATTSLIPQESANQQEPPTPEGTPTPIVQTADQIINTGDMPTNQQDVNKPAVVEQARPYNEIGLKDTLKNDAKPFLPANIGLQTISDYAQQATGWPPWLVAILTKLAVIALVVTIGWLIYRLVAWGMWRWQENERVKLMAGINSDPTRKDLYLTPTPQK